MPRNVLAIPTKTSPLSSGALSRALRQHISEHFTDTHPDAFAEDLREIAKLRDGITHIDVHIASIGAVQRYHAQLVFMGTKFPADIGLAFSWRVVFPPILPLFSVSLSLGGGSDDGEDDDNSAAGPSSAPAKPFSKATSSGQTVGLLDMRYERAAVLFTLAALYSSIGANEPRSEGESLKRAIAAFQASAGVLQYILQELTPVLSPLWSGSNARYSDADLQPAMLSAMRDAMLAQAQECFWQKAVVDRFKDVTIARLATKVSELYASALDYAQTGGSLEASADGSPKGCELPKEWINHMTIKRWHFAAAAQFRKSIDDLASNRYGDEIGRLRLAESNVKKALDSSRTGTSSTLQSDLKSLQAIIQQNLARASKDNDLIYLEAPTATSSLAPISGATMADAKTPPEVSNPIPLLREKPAPAFGRPLFQELVPYGVHVAISIFDDRKETFVREEIESRRDELDSLATSTLQSLDLPGSLQALEQPEGLPPMLVRKSEEVRSEGGLGRLHALSADVQKLARTARSVWQQCAAGVQQLPNLNPSDDAGLPAHIAERNHLQSSGFAGQVEEYGQTIQQAGQSDELVQQKIAEWTKIIGVLGEGETALENFVPGQKRSVSMSKNQSQAVQGLRVELEALDDLMDSRTAICEEAKARARRHDIRPEIMREAGIIASGSSGASAAPLLIEAAHFEPLFEREMREYDRLREELRISEREQDARLEAITARNADFVQGKSTDATVQKRQDALQSLDLGHSKYREISANLLEGLKFYNELTRMLSELQSAMAHWTQQCLAERSEFAARREEDEVEAQAATSPAAVKPRARRGTKQASEAASPSRRTRGQAAQQEQPGAPPAWGAWQGGDIRFAD